MDHQPPTRVSRSLLDPYLIPWVPRLYRVLPIPRRFPPEGIIAIGHASAIVGAVGFALSPTLWWAGLVAAAGIAGNHLADMLDGTHARETGQCRNGGELLDHFTDPLSFSTWMVGLGIACLSLPLGLALALGAVIVVYATAVLTNIRAKIQGQFTLASFGPTEFKALLVLLALALAVLGLLAPVLVGWTAAASLGAIVVAGVWQLTTGLRDSVRLVNRTGPSPDTTPWAIRAPRDARAAPAQGGAACGH